jgi:hypothetical protein
MTLASQKGSLAVPLSGRFRQRGRWGKSARLQVLTKDGSLQRRR